MAALNAPAFAQRITRAREMRLANIFNKQR